jgi:hypothetical protein
VTFVYSSFLLYFLFYLHFSNFNPFFVSSHIVLTPFLPFYYFLESPLFLLSFLRLFIFVLPSVLALSVLVHISFHYSPLSLHILSNISLSRSAFLLVYLSSCPYFVLFVFASEKLSCSTASRQAPAPTQPAIQCVP